MKRRLTYEMKDKMFAIWRCMNPIHKIFDHVARAMRASKKVTPDQYRFIEISSKPLADFAADSTNEDIIAIFHEIYTDYQNQDFYRMGYNLADMAWILRDPQDDHLSDLWGYKTVEEVEDVIKPEFFDHSKDKKKKNKKENSDKPVLLNG